MFMAVIKVIPMQWLNYELLVPEMMNLPKK